MKDIDAPDDADLLIDESLVLQEEDNAYFYLPAKDSLTTEQLQKFEAANEVVDDYFDFRDTGIFVDSTAVELAVADTRFLTDAFIVTSKQKGYQCPTSVNVFSIKSELCEMQYLRDLSGLTSLRAHLAIKNNDIADAVESMAAVNRFAYLHQEGGNTVLEYLVSLSMWRQLKKPNSELITALSSATSSSATTTNQIGYLVDTVKQSRADHKVAGDALRYEYMSNKNDILGEVHREFAVSESYFWQPNRTLHEYASLQREVINYVESPCGEGGELISNIDFIEKNMKTFGPSDLVKPNIVGKIVHSSSGGQVINIKDKGCEAESSHDEFIAVLEDWLSLRECFWYNRLNR